MSLRELVQVPEKVRHTTEVIANLDRCFLVGFGRLGPEQVQALQSLQRICSATPLNQPVSAAVEALGRSEFIEEHFVALAAARAALQGAEYDALRSHAAAALGRANGSSEAEQNGAVRGLPAPIRAWQESTRHWLMELALAGFKQLENQTLAPFTATLEHLQGEPSMTRLAALLTGFQQELLDAMPISAMPNVPIYRWVDLWTRGMIGSLRPPPAVSGRKVSGNLSVLGVDLRCHGYFASFDAYGLLETSDESRVVRITLSSYKVDVVLGPEIWLCFSQKIDPLLRAISEHVALKVQDMTLLPSGDLLWDGKAAVGKPYAFMELASEWLGPGAGKKPVFPGVQPLDRHPVQLAEPVFLEGYQVQNGGDLKLDLGDGETLDVAVERINSASELQPEHVKSSKSLLGLLRYDGGRWSVQPLGVVTEGKKGREEFTGSGAFESTKKKKGETLAILHERASKLLRKKS